MSEIEKRPLMGGIAGDDAEGFADLFVPGVQVLYNLAARVLRSAEEAENALTEVYVSAWREVSGARQNGADPNDVLIAKTRELVSGRRRARSAGRDDRPVDLESLAKRLSARVRGGAGTPAALASLEPLLCGVVARCGSVTAAVVSHVFFGGLTIGETAAALSVSPAECRSRLHGCLDMIASRCGLRGSAGHHKEFSVLAASHALAALEPGEYPEYIEHLGGGCTDCEADIVRFSRAAGKLTYLLPDVKLPPDMEEKILFSLKLARLVSGEPDQPVPAPGPPIDCPGADHSGTEIAAGADVDGPGEGTGVTTQSGPVPLSDRSEGVEVAPRRSRVMLPLALGAIALVVACGLALYSSSLRETIDRQTDLIESVQSRNTELLLRYDRLAGVSGFFESGGVVAILEGDGAYPGLTGKIVWDTSGNSAMLQILNFPPELERSELEVSAVREGRRERVAGFRPAVGDSGDVLYRFFPVDPGSTPLPQEFRVAAVEDDGGSGRVYRNLMSGTIPDRRTMTPAAGRE